MFDALARISHQEFTTEITEDTEKRVERVHSGDEFSRHGFLGEIARRTCSFDTFVFLRVLRREKSGLKDHALQAVLEMNHVEVDEQPDRFSAEFQIRQ